MARERMARLATAVQAARGVDPAAGLCHACVELLGVSGVSLMVMSDGLPSLLAASDPVGARLEDLQHSLGEGPCVEAHTSGRAVSEPDLGARLARWPAFGPEAHAAGAAALFSFPLRVGGVRLGALTLHQAATGRLSDDQHADAGLLAGLAASAILDIQAAAPPGQLSPDLEMLASHRAEVHQASGMLSVQLGVSVGEALVRLRAHAFAAERSLADVAADIVARRLRLDE